jgi:hypothetical protein
MLPARLNAIQPGVHFYASGSLFNCNIRVLKVFKKPKRNKTTSLSLKIVSPANVAS